VFRRDFLRGLDVSFAAGIHEDIQVTCAALLSADVIAAVETVCYRYRRDRPGAAMASAGTGHLAVFSAYDRVFAMLAAGEAAGRPVSAGVQAAIFERAIVHYAAVLEATAPGRARSRLPRLAPGGPLASRPGLVPRKGRREFFRRMHEDFVRHRPPGYQYPSGPRGARFRLVGRGAFRTYGLLAPLNQFRVTVQRLAKSR
jgi:hypothetical protein